MPGLHEDTDFRRRMQRMEGLLQDVEQYADPVVRGKTREIVQTLLDMHSAGLERIFDGLAKQGAVGQKLIDDLAGDDLVGSLLLLHGLHPQDCATRVQQALDGVRPMLHGHGGNVELLAITDGVVLLHLQGSCHGCPSSAATVRQSIEEAIFARAPDILAIKVEGMVEEPVKADQHGVNLAGIDPLPRGKIALPLVGG